ncbi:hypothetical protein DACRYDRAFT_23294 [Dacryopinax primogenitus]|uniref:Uncharacterized protein n=1 Tax=Dacryopinax primogenitus (strain DJM 731) TaxID=1858805 RepID=M5FVP6_DACPD|nr:uncharacterized protein DACRYDRAFT_23294 [Dacryopinax primogenitus]EJU00404.1 hypothetical protein DACRYDRAFT_23294 [Dacryopinax primogenitus]
MAVAVPAVIDPSYSFSLRTFGVQPVCKAFTTGCNLVKNPGPWGDQTLNCSGAGYPQLPYSPFNATVDATATSASENSWIFGLADNVLGVGDTQATSFTPEDYTNPAQFLLQLAWIGFGPNDQPSCDAITEWPEPEALDHPDGVVFSSSALAVFADCNLTWYNITLRSSDGLYNVTDKELSDTLFVSVLGAPLLYQLPAQHLASYLQSVALTQNDSLNLMVLLAAELGRQAMSFAAGFLIPDDSYDEELIKARLFGQYPVAPVCVIIVLLAVFILATILVGLWVILDSHTPLVSPTVTEHPSAGINKGDPTLAELAHLRLTKSTAQILNTTSDPEPSFQTEVSKLFGPGGRSLAGGVGIGVVHRQGFRAVEVYNLDHELDSKDAESS